MSKVLVLNSGSSSVKYQLFEMGKKNLLLCKGLIERIGDSSSYFSYQRGDLNIRRSLLIRNHRQAIALIIAGLKDAKSGVIKDISDISGIGHRVVHGGEEFRKPCLINNQILNRFSRYNELAPLHNPPNITGIRVCKELFPSIAQVAVFDTAFYHTIPPHAYMYALPYKFYKKYRIRRYGFHGTSHNFVIREAAKMLNKPLNRLRLISCHLGNGCSITAVKFGRAIDTSMGFTPLEGLIMGTRSGDIDPAIIFYISKKLGYSNRVISRILNRESGLLGISGISNDMRDIIARYRTDRRSKLAIEMFVYRIRKFIGAYALSLEKVDAIIFTAGLGENQPLIRKKICKDIPRILNNKNIKFLVIPTNEELMIAKDTYEILKKNFN